MRCLGFSLAALLVVCGCGDDDGTMMMATPDAPPVECEGAAITPLMGDTSIVMSDIEIGEAMDGFDLDGDGDADNKLAAVGQLAGGALRDALENFEIVLPVEFFDFPTVGPDDCVKFGIYVGAYRQDLDGDMEETATDRGDCNDHDMLINRNVAENCQPGSMVNCGDGKDNDCDGLADEVDVAGADPDTPSDDTADMDADGFSLAMGDCDDTNDMIHPMLLEICRDGYDNDCDGTADRGVTESGAPACTPFDLVPSGGDEVDLDPLSFMDGEPVISFKNGSTRMDGDDLLLEAGPSLFSVTVPLGNGLPPLELNITSARIVASMGMDAAGGVTLSGGRLGGVLDAYTLDHVRGLDVEQIMLRPEDSLADAMFANVLGFIIGLPKNEMMCMQPDIDVDGDGLEAFCDSTPDDEIKRIDTCIDGDGTMVVDGTDGTTECTEAMKDGKLRFVDGVSVELNFAAVPVRLPVELP